MKEIFVLQYWLHVYDPKGETRPPAPKTNNLSAAHHPDRGFCSTNDTETVLSRVEASCVDLTGSYHDWIKIGFAFAREHGEAGRAYFHRVSRFHPKYSHAECDKQYDQCLKEKNVRTTISSFFYLAQQAGVDTVCEGEAKEKAEEKRKDSVVTFCDEAPALATEEAPAQASEATIHRGLTNTLFNTPQLPETVYENLPELLRDSCTLFNKGIEQDVFLVAALGVLSGCLPHIEGIYFDEPHSAHLYVFITAPAGSGKGKMKWARYFGQGIHEHLTLQWAKEKADYDMKLQEFEAMQRNEKQNADRPVEPTRQMFFIPANSSSAAFIQALAENNFRGVIFETEADSLANTAKQDWGDSSDILRKAFHHETTSMARRKDKEFIEIKDPHLAIALSGTPNQVHHIMPEVENGLFSRFLYYAFEDNRDFLNPFVSLQPVDYTGFFTRKGGEIFDLYKRLEQLPYTIRFQLSQEQGARFTATFKTMLARNRLLLNGDLNASVKRLGIITFRIAMILTALRVLDTEQVTWSHQLSDSPMICSDRDYKTAIILASTLEKHGIAVYENMPNNSLKGKRLAFYDRLPLKFDRQGYLKLANELDIKPKTAEKYISMFVPKLLEHVHNEYTKVVK